MIRTEPSRAISRSSNFTIYAWGVLAWNVLVVLWGAFVRATGSGAGCGNHWPMCNGEVLPTAPALKTIIEFTHRATSGIALIAVVVLIVWAWRVFPRGHLARRGALLSGVFILTEALIGAALVLLEHVANNPSVRRGWSLSLHLLNTFTLLAVLALTAWWASGRKGIPRHYAMLGSLMVLGVSGAIAALGDTLFPVTSWSAAFAQDLSPSAHLFVRLRILHPFIAVIVTLWVLYFATRRQTPLGMAMLIAIFVQVMLGAMNLALLAPIWMQLVHLLAADAVWILAVLYSAEAGQPLAASPTD
jgi:cytochrome c oxidase assembly protein subunit 15